MPGNLLSSAKADAAESHRRGGQQPVYYLDVLALPAGIYVLTVHNGKETQAGNLSNNKTGKAAIQLPFLFYDINPVPVRMLPSIQTSSAGGSRATSRDAGS